LKNRAREIADIIKDSEQIHIVTHIDADGITAGAIAYKTLERLNKNNTIEFVKSLDENVIRTLKKKNYELTWFTDLGSSICGKVEDLKIIVTDHHTCPDKSNFPYHLNPHLFDIDGAYEISGAGSTYLVSKQIDKKNVDLSPLAIVGACGDLQDKRFNKLSGLNTEILKDAEKSNLIERKIDISFFGRETRPIHKLLQFSNNPKIPGITGRENSCINLLKELKIQIKSGDKWRRWIDLTKDERKKIISKIANILIEKGFGYDLTKQIIGEVYILKNEVEGTVLHDAKEYATLLNSTARYGQYDVGLKVCLGDREKYLEKSLNLLQGHRANLVEGLQFIKQEGIFKMEFLQYFHAKNSIQDTIVGIIANMLLNTEDVDNSIPIIGFAYNDNGEVKVSARATKDLVDKGLNLSSALKKTAKIFNGVGGGHNIAAGATIPKGKEKEFLNILETEIKSQLL